MSEKFGKMQVINFFSIFFIFCLLAPIAQASPENLNGKWYELHPYISINKKDAFLSNPLQAQNLQSVDSVNKTGGHYVYTANFDVSKAEKID